MAKIRSLEQERAKHAWEFIERIDKNFDKVASLARRLPAMLLTSGLGQTVAFCLSKDEGKRVIDDVTDYLSKVTGIEGITCGNDLLQKIIETDHETYLMLSQEALKYTTWLKRLVEAKSEE